MTKGNMEKFKRELWQQLWATLDEGAVVLVAAIVAVILGGFIWLMWNYGLAGAGIVLLILIVARLFHIL